MNNRSKVEKPSRVIPIVSVGLLEAFRQCHRRAWLEVNEPQSKESPADSQYWQLQAEAVNRAARRQFAGAFTVHGQPAEAIKQTNELLARHEMPTMFGSAFADSGLFVKPDVLEVRRRGSVVSELTASTCEDGKLDNDKLQRVALRAGAALHVLSQKGHPVSAVAAHALDRETVWDGKDPTYEGLLRRIDITGDSIVEKDSIEDLTAQFRGIVTGPEPQTKMTRHCKKPFDCPFMERCKSHPARPAATIYEIPGKHWRLQDAWAAEGWYDINEVPAWAVKQAPVDVQRIVKAIKTGKPWKSVAAKSLLDSLPYPRYWFDFEAIALALPAWANRRPYEQVPFQWSVHIERKGNKFEHKAFLDLSGNDPARACAEALLKTLGKRGPVLAYHAAYEATRLKEMAARFPDLEKGLLSVAQRLVDIEKWVHQHYYHPLMKGSYSIKKVLPALAPDFTYDVLPGVHNGVDAQLAYLSAVSAGLNRPLYEKLREGLLAYCAHDTWAMVQVAYRLTGKKPPAPPKHHAKPMGDNTFEAARMEKTRTRNVWQLYEHEKPSVGATVHWVVLDKPAIPSAMTLASAKAKKSTARKKAVTKKAKPTTGKVKVLSKGKTAVKQPE